MIYMSETTNLLIATEFPPTTEHVIEGYNEGGMLQAYETFDVSGESAEMRAASLYRDQQKDAFQAGEILNPVLNNCPNLHIQRPKRRSLYLETRALMSTQSLRIAEGAILTLEDELLNDMIALRIDEIGYVEAAATVAEGGLATAEQDIMVGIIKQSGREIYGMPDKDRALALIDERLQKAHQIVTVPNHPAHSIARELIDRLQLPLYDTSKGHVILPDETIDYYRALLRENCQQGVEFAFEETGTKEVYSVAEVQTIFSRYMEHRGFSAKGWHAETVPNRTMCATKAETRTVEIGEKRPATQRKHTAVLTSLIHEVEIHAGRQVRGADIGHGLARYGLANYVVFEEPFAASTAAIYNAEIPASGIAASVGLALAAGYDDSSERDFRDSYEIQWRLGLVTAYKVDMPIDQQVLRARSQAYDGLVRIWRGMPTNVPGCVFPKDRAYDNVDVIGYLHNDGQPLPRPDFLRLLGAKYNPLDLRQHAYIRSLTA